MNVRDGRSRIRQRFRPSAGTMLPWWYPLKWGAGARLDGLLSGYTD